MILLTDISFFQEPIEIVNINEPGGVADKVNWFIRKYEPALMADILGIELYNALQAALLVAPLADNFQKLLFGDTYTGYNGRLAKWKGIIESDTSYFATGTGLLYKNPQWLTVGETVDANGNIIITANSSSFIMPSWIGWQPIPNRIGEGPMQQGIDFDYDAETGGFSLTQGDVFQNAERLFIEFQLPTHANAVLISPNGSVVREKAWTAGIDLMQNGSVFPSGVMAFTNPDWIGWDITQFHYFDAIYKKDRDYTYNSHTGTLSKLRAGDIFEYGVDYSVSLQEAPIDANLVDSTVTYKHSFIADYIYYWYMRNHATFSTGIGEKTVSTASSTDASAGNKAATAWNDMSCSILELWQYLDASKTAFPDWYGMDYRVLRKYRKINALGI